jgi:uncharacterized protein (TIGR00297 family)
VAAVWANLSVGDAASNLVGRHFGRRPLPWNPHKSWLGSLAGLIAASAAGFVLILWTGFPAPPEGRIALALGYALATALVCAIAESLPLPIDDNLTISIVGSTFLLWLSQARTPLHRDPQDLLVSVLVPLALGGAAYALATLTPSGLVSGVVVGAVGWHAFGAAGFALLSLFFILGSFFSHVGYVRKEASGIAQPNQGRRSARHVLGKGGAATLAALAGSFVETHAAGGLAFSAAVAAALYDTTATELGQLWGRTTILLTSFESVPRGTVGGVSLEGSLAGLGAAVLIVAAAVALRLIGPVGGLCALAAATVAAHLEGYLAARTGARVSGELMNALHTSAAMLLALLLWRLQG